jgi:hypothetical protein
MPRLVRVDMRDPAERARAVEQGYIWSAPLGAIEAALEDVAAGRIPPPAFIPEEFADLAAEHGVTAAPPIDGRPIQ